jgi:hypothetical protein
MSDAADFATATSTRERYRAFVQRHEVAWELFFTALAGRHLSGHRGRPHRCLRSDDPRDRPLLSNHRHGHELPNRGDRSGGLADQLERIAALHADGRVTDQEYSAARAVLIGRLTSTSAVTFRPAPGDWIAIGAGHQSAQQWAEINRQANEIAAA